MKEKANKAESYDDLKELVDKVDTSVRNTNKVMNGVLSSLNSLSKNFEAAESNLTRYQASIDARLTGTSKSYNSMAKLISKNIGTSPFVTQTKLLETLNGAVAKGIAYNLELRSYLATIAEDVAPQFDALSENISQLIRVQQSDSTAARLGMEATLTELFNTYFSDSSYISSQLDNVSSALYETEALLSKADATELEFTAQKWLGALYSLGFSSQAVSTIASAINMLGTGNVEGLAGNSTMQSLLAMSATRANQDYADLLVNGLNASNLNDLMKSMVEYLADIASSTSTNNVVASAYGNVFGVDIADLKAISNLSDTIQDIYANSLNYAEAEQEAANRISNLSQTLNMSTQISNMLSNIAYTTGANLVNNTGTYMLYKAVDFIGDITGGVKLPTLSIMGNSIDIPELTGFIKSAMTGMSLLSTFVGAFNGGFGFNEGDLSIWGGSDVVTRGEGFNLQTTSGQSTSASIGNASGDDIVESTIADAENDATSRRRRKTGKTVEEEYDFEDLYKGLFESENASGVLSAASNNIALIESRLATMHEEMEAMSEEKALNVNIQSYSSTSLLALRSIFTLFGNMLGLSEKTTDNSGHTLQELIDFFIDSVGNDEANGGLNVNLSGTDTMATDFLTSSGRSQGGVIR